MEEKDYPKIIRIQDQIETIMQKLDIFKLPKEYIEFFFIQYFNIICSYQMKNWSQFNATQKAVNILDVFLLKSQENLNIGELVNIQDDKQKIINNTMDKIRDLFFQGQSIVDDKSVKELYINLLNVVFREHNIKFKILNALNNINLNSRDVDILSILENECRIKNLNIVEIDETILWSLNLIYFITEGWECINKYIEISNLFKMVIMGQMDVTFLDKKLKILYKRGINYNLEVLNIFNRVKNNHFNSFSFEEIKYFLGLAYCKDINRNLNLEKDCFSINNISENIIDKMLIYDKSIEIDEDTEINNFKVKDYFAVIKYLMCISLQFMRYNVTNFIIRKQDLIEKIKEQTRVTGDVGNILDYITFKVGYELSIESTPLLKKEDNYVILCYLFLDSAHWRNFLKIISIKNKEIYDNEINQGKESYMIKLIEDITMGFDNLRLYKNIPINDNNISAEIDVCIFDKESNCILIIELKNFLQPDSVDEHKKFIGMRKKEGIKKGFSQIKKLHQYIKYNNKKFLEIMFNRFEELEDIFYVLVSMKYLGNMEEDSIPLINIDIFRELIQKNNGDIKRVISDIKNRIYYPDDKDFELREESISFGEYNIEYQYYEIKDSTLRLRK